MTDSSATSAHTFNDARDRIIERAQTAKIKYEIDAWTNPSDSDPYALVVYIPCGDDSRSVTLDAEDAEAFESTPFESLEVVGSEYRSILNHQSGSCEMLLSVIPYEVATLTDLVRIPGVEFFETKSGNVMEGGIVNPSVQVRVGRDSLRPGVFIKGARMDSETSKHSWRLPIAGPGDKRKMELSPVSQMFLDFAGRWTLPTSPLGQLSLKIEGVEYRDHKSYLESIETLIGGFFFEFDQRFNVSLSVARRTVDEKRAINVASEFCGSHPVALPRVSYPRTATTLYAYGRSLSTAPLNRYLAYYQSIEHFFPLFINLNAVKKTRQVLSNPRFSIGSDADIQRLVQYAARGSIKGTSEREQLLATIQHAIDDDELNDYLDKMPDHVRTFFGKKDSLKGVPALNKKAPGRMSEQLRDRVYALRNRIVHAKEARSEEFIEPLLPFSDESRRLAADLVLIEMLSQRVIIAGGVQDGG